MTGPSDSGVQVEADCPCIGWCRDYGVGVAGERHHRDCKRWSIELGTAYLTKRELIVVGTPESDDESHNCDAMGCSSVSHVVYRVPLPVAALSDADRDLLEQEIDALEDLTETIEMGDPHWADTKCFKTAVAAIAALRTRLLRHSEGKE